MWRHVDARRRRAATPRRVDGARPRRRGTAARRRRGGQRDGRGARRTAQGYMAKGAARQCPPVRSAPSEGASRISNSGGHERRSSVQQAQSRWPWSRPARQSLLSVPPWCWCNRRGCSRSPKLAFRPRRAATAAGYALSICKALLMRRDASPSRVLVTGRTVYRRGGDASGERSESDAYSGWDARARTSGSRAARFRMVGMRNTSSKACRTGPQGRWRVPGRTAGTRTLGSLLARRRARRTPPQRCKSHS